MYQCPECGSELVPDQNNPGKVLCYTCKKRFSEADVANYWQMSGGSQAQPQMQAPQYGAQPTMQMPSQAPGVPPMNPQQQAQYMPQQGMGGQPGPDMVIGGGMGGDPTQPGMAPNPQMGGYAPNPVLPKGMALASLIIGILMLLGSWVPLVNVINIIGAIVAIVLGVLAIKKVKNGLASGKGLAIGGIVTSALTIVVSLAITGFTMWAGMAMVDMMSDEETASEIIAAMDELNSNGNSSYDDEYTYDTDNGATSNTNATAGSSGSANDSSAAVDALLVADSKIPWGAMKFTFEGKEYQLGKTTLKDFESSGWKLDLEAAGYSDGFIVNPNSGQSTIPLEKEGAKGSVFVSVSNLSSGTLDITECVLSSFRYDAYSTTDIANGSIVGTDIKLGGNFSDAVAKLPEPADQYVSGERKSYDYEDEGYNRLMDVTADNNIITSFSLKCFF